MKRKEWRTCPGLRMRNLNNFVKDIRRMDRNFGPVQLQVNKRPVQFQDFDSVRHVLEHIPYDEDDRSFFEKEAMLRLAQLDVISESLSHNVMEHYEEMMNGMQLVMEVQQDLNVANVICMNGRRHLTSSMNEVSQDLIVNSSAKKKQVLLDMLPILTELHRALDMKRDLEVLVDEGSFLKAFQVLSEYLQILESFTELSAIQEMSKNVEVWLGKALQKLDSLLMSACQEFNAEIYSTVVDAYALLGDAGGLSEKMQSFFMQEILSKTYTILMDTIEMESESENARRSRLTYSEISLLIPESKFRACLLGTLDILFKIMCSYYNVMSFEAVRREPEFKSDMLPELSEVSRNPEVMHVNLEASVSRDLTTESTFAPKSMATLDEGGETSLKTTYGMDSVWDVLRNDTVAFVAQSLQQGRRNLWNLVSSRVSVLLSSSAVYSTSMHQFLKTYEDLNLFTLSGEAFCGVEAVEFRKKLRYVCENYLISFHRQNICAFKMVLDKESWLEMSSEAVQAISLAGLLGDGAPIVADANDDPTEGSARHLRRLSDMSGTGIAMDGFAHWLWAGNPFISNLASRLHEPCNNSRFNGPMSSCQIEGKVVDLLHLYDLSADARNSKNKNSLIMEDESEDLLADFIDEDSQLPSRILKPVHDRNLSVCWANGDIAAHSGSSICLLRLMDKYARLMQKFKIVKVQLFKGICQLFELYFHYIFEAFGRRDAYLGWKGSTNYLTYRLETALSRITQDCEEWIKPEAMSWTSVPSSFANMDVAPTSPHSHGPNASFGLKERCLAAETISHVAQMLQRSRAHLQSVLVHYSNTVVEVFYTTVVDCVPELIDHIHRATAMLFLHINGYVDRIVSAKWEPKDIGLEHNGYVDLLLGEFKHYKTRLVQGGIQVEVQNILVEHGLEHIVEILVEGFSRIKRCTDEGRALMSLDLQVLINGLQHLVSTDVKPKMQVVDTFVKAYYLPETEYVHWARSHPEYTRSQIVGLVNLVAGMKGWKRKSRLDVLEKIEAQD